MKIFFYTKSKNAASTELNIPKLDLLNELQDVSIDFYKKKEKVYDIILLMGYDCEIIPSIKKENPSALIGVIDPRPPAEFQPIGVDFLLANGLEMADYYYQFCPNIFNYYIYPILEKINPQENENDIFKIGYHGNKIHLVEMESRIIPAIIELAREVPVSFYVMYNIKALGKWQSPKLIEAGIPIHHIQWSIANYQKVLSKVDVGIVPNIMSIANCDEIKDNISSNENKFNEHATDYLLRFKATSNLGRILAFAQMEIPVIVDMFPSALSMIRQGENGYIAHSTAAWHYCLKSVSENKKELRKIGQQLFKDFQENYAPKIQNEQLIAFLKDLKKKQQVATVNPNSKKQKLIISKPSFSKRVLAFIKSKRDR